MKNIYWVYVLLRVVFVKGQRDASHLGLRPVPDRYEISQPIPTIPNQIYSTSASRHQTKVFWFQPGTTKGTAKIQVWSKNATVDAPVLIVIKRHVRVLSWQIPAMLQEAYPYLTTNRTLCPASNHYSSVTKGEPILPSGVDIFIEVLTLSDQPVDFSPKIESYPTFVKNGLSSFIMRASPSAPQYIQYNMRPRSTTVLVKLEALEVERGQPLTRADDNPPQESRQEPAEDKETGDPAKTATAYRFILVALFICYGSPVFQLVFTHQKLLHVIGNEDLCYYNFSCAKRAGWLSDLNHVISNLGYVILGVLFLLQVRRRKVFRGKLRSRLRDRDLNLDAFGSLSHFDIYYSMSYAVIMEGMMSLLYHICPGYNNFQFDTSFMYLICGLLVMKLYH
ncbi:hypothetical protein RvY_11733 [Ramazzottius varieornatus]|uniref:SID1 transmembrane family member 1 n=1 Tax=Ramazzottius varieornatus TaxID=947166 RepID=A0A1D1VLE8_RAMVA|nr:hypothetical protein RvY_11733 [Ramazzottius varieornatus]